MNLLSQLRSQPTAVATLERAVATDRVNGGYLFDGPDGVGKELAAFGFAQALLCIASKNGRACGTCSACERSIPQGKQRLPKHPDIAVLERGLYEPAQIGRRTPETQDISIDQVRTIVLSKAAFAPHEGKARVFIVRGADDLSITAANALLKTLEEPNRLTHFILITSRPNALLPTIRSRVQRIRFGPIVEADLVALLIGQGVEKAQAQGIAELAGGSMSQAALLADAEASEERTKFVQAARGAMKAPHLLDAFLLAEDGKKDKEGIEPRLVTLLQSLVQEARLAPNSPEAVIAAQQFRRVQQAIRGIDSNGSPQLVLESMFIDLQRMASARV